MHLGNGALTPECALLTGAIATTGLGFAAWQARQTLGQPQRWLAAGIYGAAIFAAQMVNVPLLPYASGHLVGGVLLAAALGPGLGAWAMSCVLLLQAVLLGDGGLSALGANIINMALLPAMFVGLGQQAFATSQPPRTLSLRLGTVAALAVLSAAGLIVLEVAMFRTDLAALPAFAGEMLGAHLVIGLAEGVLTAAIVLAASGDLLPSNQRSFALRTALASGVAVLLLVTAESITSDLPDGYEASAERSHFTQLLAE
ncbi:MAG TPA: energy-coupling factor ABC transporter permease [Pirellulaceae bacterium]|nr:energy-coupling factor ABC transporter permease [Pirellulaceae bacterium]